MLRGLRRLDTEMPKIVQIQIMNDPHRQGCRAIFKTVYYTKMSDRRQCCRLIKGELRSGTGEAGAIYALPDQNFILIFQFAGKLFLRQGPVVQDVSIKENFNDRGISDSPLDECFR
jgi:hypothetical protein